MKPVIKTTAVAILVALGVTACGPSSSSTSDNPTPANDQANTNQNQVEKAKAEAEAKEKEAAEKAKAEAEKAKLAAEKAKAEADAKAKELAEKAKVEAEKAKLAAEKAKTEADAKAKEAAEKAKAEAEKAKLAAEKAKAEAEKKAAELKAKQEAEAKAKAEAEKKAAELKAKQEAEAKAKAEAEAKAKAEADAKAKEAAEKAKLEAEKAKAEAEKKAAELKAKQEAEAKAKADAKAKEAAEKAKLEAEKKANEWRSGENSGNITDPRILKQNSADHHTARSYYHRLQSVVPGGRNSLGFIGYADSFDDHPPAGAIPPIFDDSNEGFKLDYYQLAKSDVENPQVLGVHKGSIKSPGINGAEATAYNEKHKITATNYPEKADYLFINTPYTTYGAVYNANAAILFASSESGVDLDGNITGEQIGSYEVIDGNKTNKIAYNDSVKGSATYKGEVIAVPIYLRGTQGSGNGRASYIGAPSVDGTVTFEANFGTRAEENYIAGTLDSKLIGKVALPKSRIDTLTYGFGASKNLDNNSIPTSVRYNGYVVGKDANGVQGNIYYSVSPDLKKEDGALSEYEAVFAAEKQPK